MLNRSEKAFVVGLVLGGLSGYVISKHPDTCIKLGVALVKSWEEREQRIEEKKLEIRKLEAEKALIEAQKPKIPWWRRLMFWKR